MTSSSISSEPLDSHKHASSFIAMIAPISNPRVGQSYLLRNPIFQRLIGGDTNRFAEKALRDAIILNHRVLKPSALSTTCIHPQPKLPKSEPLNIPSRQHPQQHFSVYTPIL